MTDEKPSLLILSGVQGDPRRYRTFHLFEQARLAGLECELSHVTDPGLRKKVDRSMVVILHRAPYDAQVAWMKRNIQGKGGVFILDLDDRVFDPEAVKYIHSPDFADPVRRSLYQEDIRRHRKTLDLCDAAITTSEYLAQSIRQLGKPAYVHRNAFSLEMQALSDKAYHSRPIDLSKIVIGYASGTPTHDQDFALVTPALQHCLSRYPNVELWLVGRLDPVNNWDILNSQIKKFSFVPWRNLPELQARFDINLAPLEINNPFGQSKSENKYLEAALLRVPTIASPSEAYNTAIRQGENGYLADDGLSWEQSLEKLIGSAESRNSMGESAHQDVLHRYHPEVRAAQLVETLNLIAGHQFEFRYQPVQSPGVSPSSVWSSAEQERYPTLFQRGEYTLMHRNIPTLIKQIWIFFRRLVSPIFPYRYSPERTDYDALPR